MESGIYMITNAHFHHPLTIKDGVQISPLEENEIPNSALWKITYDVAKESFELQNVQHKMYLNLVNKNLSMEPSTRTRWSIVMDNIGYYLIFAFENGSSTSLKAGDGRLGSDTYSDSDNAKWSIRVVKGSYFAIVSKVFEQYLCIDNSSITAKEYGILREFLWEVISLGNEFQIRNIKFNDQKLEISHTIDKAKPKISTYAHGTGVPHSLWKINELEDGTYKIVNQATSQIVGSVSTDTILRRDAHLQIAHILHVLNSNITNDSYDLSWYKHGIQVPLHARWIFQKIGPLRGLAYETPAYIDWLAFSVRKVHIESNSGNPPSLGKFYLLENRLKKIEIQSAQSNLNQERIVEEAKNERDKLRAELLVQTGTSKGKVNELAEQTERNLRDLPTTITPAITDAVAATLEAKFLQENGVLVKEITEIVLGKVLSAIRDGGN